MGREPKEIEEEKNRVHNAKSHKVTSRKVYWSKSKENLQNAKLEQCKLRRELFLGPAGATLSCR